MSMSDPLNHLGSIWLENIYEISKCGGGNFFWRVEFFKNGKHEFTFIREMRVKHFKQIGPKNLFLKPVNIFNLFRNLLTLSHL